MKRHNTLLIIYFALVATLSFGQSVSKRVVITGVRFSYPLVEKWIADYKKANPSVDVVIEARTVSDPASYDVLIEAYEPDAETKNTRDCLYIARYAVLPVANSSSPFAKHFEKDGLTEELIKQLYFHDIYADKKKAIQIDEPYKVLTRLQKAGAPSTFAKYFGYDQKDIKGKAIAGADEHLIKSAIADSSALTYGPLSLIYDLTSKKQREGLVVLPVDLNGNGRIHDDERIFENVDAVISHIESGNPKSNKNIPVEHIHLSVSKSSASAEAIKFLQWVIYNGQNDLHEFGYLKPDTKIFDESRERFEQRAKN